MGLLHGLLQWVVAWVVCMGCCCMGCCTYCICGCPTVVFRNYCGPLVVLGQLQLSGDKNVCH